MKTAALILALLVLVPAPVPVRGETLGEMAASAGTDWMIGKWKSEDGNVSIAYTWKLDKNAVGVVFKLGERESEGMIMRKPGTDEVVYGAVDNKGGLTTGHWVDYNGNPTLITNHTDAEGKERKMAAEHVKTDDKTMTVRLYSVGSDGKPDATQSREVVFKRQS